MKFSYIFQLKDFSLMLFAGVIIGILYGLLNISTTIKKIWVIQIVVDIIFCILSLATFLALTIFINLGEFRMFLLLGYVLGYYLERLTLGKLFAKGYKKVYNGSINILKKFANSKLGRMILK